jgi:predicted CxxxxCH...CXXCH cytochrome family protein
MLLLTAACDQVGRSHPNRPCIDCHEKDLSRSKVLDHTAEGFPRDCEQCHQSTSDWKKVVGHDAFPLDGKHATLACARCHSMDPVPKTCVGCHDKDRERATSPDHSAPGYPTDCSRCHTTSGWTIDNMTCNACHGSEANDAPPPDTQGNSQPGAAGVGAHQAHVEPGARHGGFDCSECHIKPAAVPDKGHTDSALPAEVTFGSVATGKPRSLARTPKWDSAGRTCASTYCHDPAGAGLAPPSWNNGKAPVCGSCHGLPPSKTLAGTVHAPSSLSDCSNCHPAVVDAAGAIINPGLHVNGKVNLNQ